ncbi:MAG: D-tyrosyl-tRNA(Tyr) deacylase [Spirochaetes bacterium GWD1_27_9]|nr:MAG: D-tyrosyl-tRNA(Tyr) deacylase [Spirochaetes bacterium GWB1_27_13]OHD26326.1 MAG: D-tyrosyl-tRNA(Tyr) deacylase [Spirochaetes bacterium GWC1_27_15]OHD38769.1 MAG: D-tyrosyl-tRNA(Tyr) deacylase [Spirochaetes bacterium GWD1_27_9]
MRAVIQRVKKASVTVEGKIVSSINTGLLVLLGVSINDQDKDIDYMIDKILNLRIFPDEEYKMNKSITDVSGEMIVVSQFTLYGDARKGRRPSYDIAAKGDVAKPIYEKVVNILKEKYDANKVFTGIFAAMMDVELINDGPVTILLDSERNF